MQRVLKLIKTRASASCAKCLALSDKEPTRTFLICIEMESKQGDANHKKCKRGNVGAKLFLALFTSFP